MYKSMYFITLKNNTEVTNNSCYAFASFGLLRLFFTSNFKNYDKYLVPPEIFFAPSSGCVGLATALAAVDKFFNVAEQKFRLNSSKIYKFYVLLNYYLIITGRISQVRPVYIDRENH